MTYDFVGGGAEAGAGKPDRPGTRVEFLSIGGANSLSHQLGGLGRNFSQECVALTGRLHGTIVGPTGLSDRSVRPVG